MPVPTQTVTSPPPQTQTAGSLKLRGNHVAPQTEVYADLDINGFCVVPKVLDQAKAAKYVDDMYKWLEGFGKGFKGDDKDTWTVDRMPYFAKGGLFNRHACGHEQFAWDVRCEPAVIDVFAKIWGTDELLVSFDAVNVSLPYKDAGSIDRKPWAHVDQSPNRRFKHCVQGIVNLAENGPKDGGLMVLQGSFPLYNEFFEAHEHEAPEGGWDWKDSYHHTPSQLQWFYDRGCTWKKVEAGPGDVILWDSRCIHYGAAAEGDASRVCTYVCYKPAKDASPEQLVARKECIDTMTMTSHDPIFFRKVGPQVSNEVEPNERRRPSKEPVLTERGKQLAGILAY